MHYARVHPDQWCDRIRTAGLMGLNAIETYVMWNFHEPVRGQWDATGPRDLGRFLDLIADEGMHAIVRPGPYVCAEWHNGGPPTWLTSAPDMRLRSSDPRYLEAVTDFLARVSKNVVPRQIDTGGSVILVQIENEYGAYGSDKAYLAELIRQTRDAGNIVPLTQVDQPIPHMLENGAHEGLHKTGSFGARITERLAILREHQPNRLRPVFEALVASERPQTAVTWLTRPPGHGPDLLRKMACSTVSISHDRFAALPMTRARNYLRDLLVALEVLDSYEPRIERITPWLAELVAPLNPTNRHLVDQFARWLILRRLRTAAKQGELTKAMGESARPNLRQAIRLLAKLEREGVNIAEVTQLPIDAYLAAIPQHMPSTLSTFAGWLNRTGINTSIRIENPKPPIPRVTMSDTDRWSRVHLLLHDESIRP